jgi:hypothetical protein
MGQVLSPGEARRSLFHGHVGAARVLRSQVDLQESDFDEMGDAFADVSRWVPKLRLVLRFFAPLILIGALIAVWANILGHTPWVLRWRARRAERRAARAQARGQAAPAPMPAPSSAGASAPFPTPSPADDPLAEDSALRTSGPLAATGTEGPDNETAPSLPLRIPGLTLRHRL